MRRTPGNTPKEREQYWTKIIQEARKNPGGVKAYCDQKGILINSFYSWFKKLRPTHPEWHQDLSHISGRKKSTEVRPTNTEVEEKPQRRKFTKAYKVKILREAEGLPDGQLAALLRREGLYSSILYKWQRDRDLRALEPKKRGRKANPLLAENKKLQAKNARLEKQLHQATVIIELQKKIAQLLSSEPGENHEAE
jgi:transposase